LAANVSAVDEGQLRRSLEMSPLLRLVSLAGHVTGQRYRRVMADHHGLTPASANTLSMLAWGTTRGFVDTGTPGRATHAELARRLLITPATLTGIVDTLVKAGFVARERGETDRRVVWLVLTDEGRAMARSIGSQLRDALDRANRPSAEHEAIIREYLTELIMKYHDKESLDESAHPSGQQHGSPQHGSPQHGPAQHGSGRRPRAGTR
jgi:DNA-binding MarR family transcriptional regulator